MKCADCADEAVYRCVVCERQLCPKHARLHTVCGTCVKGKRLDCEIRKSTTVANEQETIGKLVRLFWGEDEQLTFGRRFRISKTSVYIAELKDEILGFVAFARLGDALIIVALGVLPMYQNCGVGRKLMEQVEIEARKQGKKKLLVSTSNDDLPALAFYQHIGFKIFDVKPNVIAEKHGKVLIGIGGLPVRDELRMRKML